ncbi:MAG: hypothetical protein ACT4TC_22860 [Myxococcaceae bacterium]
MRALLALLLLASMSCKRFVRLEAQDAPVEVEQLGVRFSGDTQGTVRFTLLIDNERKRAGEVTTVSWELWLSNRLFASGTEALNQPVTDADPQRVEVVTPFVFRRRSFTEIPRNIPVAVRGTLQRKVESEESTLLFQHQEPMTLPRSLALDAEED